MAPLVSRIIGAVRPDTQTLGTCLVCRHAIDAREHVVGLGGGGRVHARCATYRMRHRTRGKRRPAPHPHRGYTGD